MSIAADYPVGNQQIRYLLRKRGVEIKRFARDRYEDQHGYLCKRVEDGDTIGQAMLPKGSRYVQEHRLLIAHSIGRPLTSNETVHHIDGNKANNALSNLQLRQGNHGPGVVLVCFDCGSHNVVASKIAENVV